MTGAVTDWKLPAAALDTGGGRPASVEGACPEEQSGTDGSESLQPFRHWQVPDRWGLVSRGQAAWASERSEGGWGKMNGAARMEMTRKWPGLLKNPSCSSSSSEEEWQYCRLVLQPPAFPHLSTHPISTQLLHGGFPEHRGCLRRSQLPWS